MGDSVPLQTTPFSGPVTDCVTDWIWPVTGDVARVGLESIDDREYRGYQRQVFAWRLLMPRCGQPLDRLEPPSSAIASSALRHHGGDAKRMIEDASCRIWFLKTRRPET